MPCQVQLCGNDTNSALCQLDTEIMEYYSLGTYTNFQWTITDCNPLEFMIHYDGGTEASVAKRKLIKKSFVYFKKGNGPTKFTFVNEEHPVIYVSQMDVVVVNPIIIGAHVQQGPQLFVCVCVCATLALL
ncbi:hypothetical protein GBAR_LOCUS6460 [Geodia barretti]|uniref:Uncharacterized protein n=1 Tax=Geodia barretti TaxID=519541 RepID=A0AA35RFE2_GEOBA|nr:hypothetical protein GBAR_LOCUS6460 [Geodia barretti]